MTGPLMTTHLVIPDTQIKPGVPTDHLAWIGQYVVDRKPDVVVHLGDHWDFPSLSSYDRGKKAMEGRRYSEDVEAGNLGLDLLTAPIRKEKLRVRDWLPRLELLRGNHEERLNRAIEDDARMDGALSFDDLESPGWEVHDFLKPVWVDGIAYSHYFANPMTGRPYGGMVSTRLKNIGHSFTMGHVQTLDSAQIPVPSPNGPTMRRGLVAGACYLHNEDYKGFQGNAHWRGVLVKHEVFDGNYDLMEVSLEYLCLKYEGVPISQFMAAKYPSIRRWWRHA